MNFINKYLWNARAVVLLGFFAWVLVLKFGDKNYDGSLGFSITNSVMIIFGFLAMTISLFGYLVMTVKDYFFRSSQMSNLAQKYNLNYSKPKEPFIQSPLKIPYHKSLSSAITKKNIIEGIINGKNILICDFIDYYAYNFGFWFNNTISRGATIISVDGRKKELRSFFTGFGSVKKIDSILADLSKEK